MSGSSETKKFIANLITTLKGFDFLHIDDTVSSWSNTVSNNKFPTEKLVKDSLDSKLDKTHTSYKGKNVVTNSSTGAIEFEDKNNHSHSQYLTSHQDISGKENTSNKVSSWSGTTDNTHYPTEKLVKDSLDLKANTSSLSTVATTGDYEDLLNLPEEICITDFYYDATSDELVLNTCTDNDISTITSKEDKSNKVTSWSATPTHSHYPSEKLVKDYIDDMIGDIIEYIEG